MVSYDALRRSIGRRRSGLLALLLFALAACGPSAAPAASPASAAKAPSASSPIDLKVAWVAITSHTLPTWIAESRGFFRQQGLNAQVSYIQGSTTAIPALMAGDLGMLEATPAASVQAQLKGQDMVVLATHIPYADQRLVGLPGIKSVSDLRGKTVAVTKPGTVTDVVMRAVLKQNGLTPGKDVQITFLDSQPGQVAALKKGLVQAILTDPPFYLMAEKAGAQEILDTLTLHYPYPEDGVVTTRKFVRNHPEAVRAYLKAFVQGIQFIRSNPAETKQILSEKTKEADPAILDASYDVLLDDLADNPVPGLDGIKTVLPLFEGGVGKEPAAFIDAAPLAQAIDELKR